jgi:uncharacterized protein YqgV (UPF0045/DUF77 family)
MFAGGLSNASKPSFDLTTRGTAIAVFGVAVVAILIQHQAITTLGSTSVALTVRLDLTVGGATIERKMTAVVAGFRA